MTDFMCWTDVPDCCFHNIRKTIVIISFKNDQPHYIESENVIHAVMLCYEEINLRLSKLFSDHLLHQLHKSANKGVWKKVLLFQWLHTSCINVCVSQWLTLKNLWKTNFGA